MVRNSSIFNVTIIGVFAITCMSISLFAVSPIRHWKFDETSGDTAYDEYSISDATINGATINQPGRVNKSYSFDGIDDYVSISNPAGLTSETGAIEFWMKADVAHEATLFHFYETATSNYIRCYLSEVYEYLDLVIEDDNVVKVSVRYDLNNLPGGYIGEWIHVMWVQDGTSVKLYINGEGKTLTGTNSGSWWSDHLSLSAANIGGSGAWGYFDGSIDEFKLYNTAPDANDAYSAYTNGETVLDLTLDDGTGSIAVDSSAFANDATLYISPSGWISGMFGDALQLDGTDDIVEISSPSGFSTSVGTIEFWMKADTAHDATLFHFYETTTTDYIRCFLSEVYEYLDLTIEDNNAVKVNLRYDLNNLPDGYIGQWIHVAWVQDGTEIKLYINGEERLRGGTGSGSWWMDHLNIAMARIGYGSWGYFDGIIDEFKVHSRALNSEEIKQSCGLDVAAWHFDEATGTTAYDECGQNDATISGVTINQDGMLGKSYSFDGIDDYVSISNPVQLTSEAGAIEFWMKADNVQNATLFHFYEVYRNDYIRCFLDSTYERLDLVIEDDNVVKVSVRYDLNNLPGGYIGEWIHVMWVQDGTSVKLYINGEEKTLTGTSSGSWWTDHLSLTEATIGAGGWGYFDGNIDEFMVYKRSLSANEVYQKYVDHGHYKDFGYENNPTGDPIGGGTGYIGIYTTGDYIVDTKTEVFTALNNASSGDVIFVSGNIDLTGEDSISIPSGVTLAGDRGYNGSNGALLKTDTVNTSCTPLFVAGGSNIRITGLRLQGPASGTDTTDYSDGIQSAYSGLEVDNCEISAWAHAGIHLLDGGTSAHIHHNYIHHCRRNGLGYGVSHGYGYADSLIEANKFDYNRHSVAGTGTTGNSYEARYNLVLEHATGHVFDMHGGADRDDGTDIAGDDISIHHNTVMVTDQYSVVIRGIPNNNAVIYNNWFYRSVGDGAIQTNAFGNFLVYDNLYTSYGCYKSSE